MDGRKIESQQEYFGYNNKENEKDDYSKNVEELMRGLKEQNKTEALKAIEEYYSNKNNEFYKGGDNSNENNKSKQESLIDSVFENSPIYSRMKKQIRKGISKYGVEVKPENYTLYGWFDHVQDELVDATTYNEIMLVKLESVINSLEIVHKNAVSNNDQESKIHIKHALSVIKGDE